MSEVSLNNMSKLSSSKKLNLFCSDNSGSDYEIVISKKRIGQEIYDSMRSLIEELEGDTGFIIANYQSDLNSLNRCLIEFTSS